ncbi:MAG: lipoprotein [Dehalococcoidia bacterium]|nr:MAG: lipoprotein [Dehalococcoidia bacterium]
MKRLVLLSVASTLIFAAVVTAAVAVMLTTRPKPVTASLMANALPAADFSLRDTEGRSVTLSSLRGKPVLLTFGYTSCPDVCPVTLVKLAQAKAQLGPRGKDLQVLFITVDPDRDRPDVVRSYLAQYDPAFLGLIPTPEELEEVAKTYHVVYEKQPGSEAAGYTMAHTAATLVIDREGRVRMLFWPEMSPDEMASDLQTVLGL